MHMHTSHIGSCEAPWECVTFTAVRLPSYAFEHMLTHTHTHTHTHRIMSDDMGWGEPGLYPSTSEHGVISTPNLDKFGQSGIQVLERRVTHWC